MPVLEGKSDHKSIHIRFLFRGVTIRRNVMMPEMQTVAFWRENKDLGNAGKIAEEATTRLFSRWGYHARNGGLP